MFLVVFVSQWSAKRSRKKTLAHQSLLTRRSSCRTFTSVPISVPTGVVLAAAITTRTIPERRFIATVVKMVTLIQNGGRARLQRRRVKRIQKQMMMEVVFLAPLVVRLQVKGCTHGELKLRNEKETAFVNLYRSRKQRSLLVAMFLHGRSCIVSSARDSVVLVGIGSTNLI